MNCPTDSIATLQESSTFIELLRNRAINQPDQIAYRFFQDGELETGSFTYAQLDQRARTIATKLQSLEATGTRALLLYPPGLEFIAAFFGCLYAGVVAVPAYPPRRNQSLARLQAILSNAEATIALTTTTLLDDITRRFQEFSEFTQLRWLATDPLSDIEADVWQPLAIDGDQLAFLQYTSGSTGTPKGVMVSHANLMHNSALIQRCFADTPSSCGVSWLPPYHDMGLIGGILQPLYVGAPMLLMPPLAFLQKPFRWLDLISRYKGTSSGGPNFAYDLCVRKLTPEHRERLDLSSWQLAFTGAEPVRSETLEQFAAVFADCGFREAALHPCYGMAETTLMVSGGVKTMPPIYHRVVGTALEQNRVVAAKTLEDSRTIVGCGQAGLDYQVLIVNPDTCLPCAEHEVGEIWVAGPSVAQGYWNRAEETQTTFQAHLANTGAGPFLRTGDLGFLLNGELFITGRIKDLMIIRGQNHYPQDIELTVENSHPALRSGCGAAFTVEVKREERLVIVQEVERTHLRQLNVKEIVGCISQRSHHSMGYRFMQQCYSKQVAFPKLLAAKFSVMPVGMAF